MKSNTRKIIIIIVCLALSNIITIASSVNFKINNFSQENTPSLYGVEWEATINFDETMGATDWVIFGEATDANDGPPADSYDAQKPPPSPTPYVRAWLDDNLPAPLSELSKDYRSYPDTDKIWNLTVQWFPSDYSTPSDISISWDIPDISQSEYDSVTFDGVDMLTQDSYVFTASAIVPYNFQIICSVLPNESPEISNENPNNGDTNIPVSLSSISVLIDDSEDDNFDWSIETSPNIGSNNANNQGNGIKTCIVSGLAYSTTYTWYVNTTDPLGSGEWTRETFTFTTEPANQPPNTPSSPSPSNNAVGVSLNPTLRVYVSDPDNDDMDVYFYDSSDTLIGSKSNVDSGSFASVQWNGRSYNTDYYWYVNVSDSEYQTRGPSSSYWHFKTRVEDTNQPPQTPTNPNPEDGSEDADINPIISVYVEDPDNDLLSVSFYNESDDSIIGTVDDVESGSNPEVTWSDLSYNTSYSWYVNVSDSEYTITSDTWSFSTKEQTNNPPVITINKPVENSIYFRNNKIFNFARGILIIGFIEIYIEADDEQGIEKIQLFINDEKINDYTQDSFTYTWDEKVFGSQRIEIKAFGNDGSTKTISFNVWKFF